MCIVSPEELSRILGLSLNEIDCAGLKLTLDRVYSLESNGLLGRSSRKLPEYREVIPRDNVYFLERGSYLIKYSEYIHVPNGYIGLAIQRSSLLRMGASLYTAVWDPGYEGRGSGLLVVHNPYGVYLENGVQIAQLVYIRMTSTTNKLYRGIYYREK